MKLDIKSKSNVGGKNMKNLETSIEKITPIMAANMLSMNDQNRNIRQRVVKRYADEIAAGNWQLNGESIKIATDGRILDGQHRLSAIVKSGIPIESLVIRNVPEDVFKTIDVGAKRTGADALVSMGIDKYSGPISAALGVLSEYERQPDRSWVFTTSDRKGRFSNVENLKVYKKYKDIIHAVESFQTIYSQSSIPIISLGAGSGYYYMMNEIDHVLNESFWFKLITGIGMGEGDPILALRNKIIELRSTNARLDRVYIGPMISYVWQACREGRALSRIKIPENYRPYFG